jgi:tetratricopeptide (TPR) repeat protein
MSSGTPPTLTPSQQESFKRAKSAAEKQNYDYAISLLSSLLKEVPAFTDGRRLLRANELVKAKNASSFSKSLSSVKIAPLYMRGKNALKKAPAESIITAEEILAIDPTSEQGNELLAEAATASGLPDVAVLAWETLSSAKPNDIKILKSLAQAYLTDGKPEKAQEAYQKVIAINKTDGEAIKGLKDVSAMIASSKGGWDAGDDYRSSLKNAEEARLLEQASRVVKSEESIDEQIALLYNNEFQANNKNVDVVIKIAKLCELKKDLESAIQWYQYANEVNNGADPVIEKSIVTLQQKILDQQLVEAKKNFSQVTDPADQEAWQDYITQLEQQKARFTLESARAAVDKYPTDLGLRFELGQVLFQAGEYREAVPELQQALRQPAVRHRALFYLGQCYAKNGLPDLAIKQFQTAKSEIVPMDALKKEIIYTIGTTLESLGRKEEALEEFKSIYEVDYQYRDVAARVEAPPEDPVS